MSNNIPLHTPWGLDLSQFKSRNVGIDKPFERTFGSIQKSLERGFGVNPETCAERTSCELGGGS